LIKFSVLNLLPPYKKHGAHAFNRHSESYNLNGENLKNNLAAEDYSLPKNDGYCSKKNNSNENIRREKTGEEASLKAIGAFYARHEKAKRRSQK